MGAPHKGTWDRKTGPIPRPRALSVQGKLLCLGLGHTFWHMSLCVGSEAQQVIKQARKALYRVAKSHQFRRQLMHRHLHTPRSLMFDVGAASRWPREKGRARSMDSSLALITQKFLWAPASSLQLVAPMAHHRHRRLDGGRCCPSQSAFGIRHIEINLQVYTSCPNHQSIASKVNISMLILKYDRFRMCRHPN